MANNKIKETAVRVVQNLRKQISFWPPSRPGGNVVDKNLLTPSGEYKPILDQISVKALEPYGTKVPKHILERASGWSQLQNVSHNFTMENVQAAFRAAERGDMQRLFAYYRDFFIGNSTVAAELSKRKLSTISEPWRILPADKKNPDDVNAAKVIEEALNKYPSFNQSLVHCMNAVVYPVACLEKIFEPIDESYGLNKYNLRYKIKQLEPVDYNLITYRLPYIPQGPINVGNQPVNPIPPMTQDLTGRPEDTVWDPDSWEPNLRFWSVFDNGLINFSYAYMMAPDPYRHMIYRCDLLHGITRENVGTIGKPLLFLAIMSQLGLDVFLQCLQKYGIPLIVAKVDTSQIDTVNKIMQAFETINIVRALAINKDAEIQLEEINMSGAADAHTKFLEWIDNRIALLINGQTLSSNAKSTGLGSGVADLQGSVREDIVKYDRLCLGELLQTQLFKQYLDINGIKGSIPKIVWGGDSKRTSLDLSTELLNLSNAGFAPTDDAIEQLSETLGYTIQKISDNTTSSSNSVTGDDDSSINNKENNIKNTNDDDEIDEKVNAEEEYSGSGKGKNK